MHLPTPQELCALANQFVEDIRAGQHSARGWPSSMYGEWGYHMKREGRVYGARGNGTLIPAVPGPTAQTTVDAVR